MADIKALAEELVNLSVKDVQELAKVLKEEYGIEPAAAAVVVAADGGNGAAAQVRANSMSSRLSRANSDLVLRKLRTSLTVLLQLLKRKFPKQTLRLSRQPLRKLALRLRLNKSTSPCFRGQTGLEPGLVALNLFSVFKFFSISKAEYVK